MSIKLKDIANEVGLSISTVSRALNEETSDKVKPSTKIQIEYAMKKLGYNQNITPNFIPRNDNPSIGIILASTRKSFDHEYFAEMLNALLIELYKSNCQVGYVLAQASLDEETFKNVLQTTPVTGAIIMGRLNDKLLSFLKQNIGHIVYTGVNYIGHDTDEVTCNGYNAIQTLYDHFKFIGYNDIGYIGSTANPNESKNDFQRFDSYMHCIKLYGDTYKKEHVENSDETNDGGYEAMKKMILAHQVPKAIICTSDSIAIGVIHAANEHNINIPKDVAIAGIDNLNLSQYLSPPLTTVDVPKAELSRLAINMLLDKISNNREKNIRLDIPGELIIRASCGYPSTNTNSYD